MIIDGKKISKEILTEVERKVAELPFVPVFCDILVGSDPASVQYVRMKGKTAESVGIKFRAAEFPESITTDELIAQIGNLNRVPHMCGIIVQLPLPAHIDRQAVLDAIDPLLDVDCLGSSASRMFYTEGNPVGYPTAMACMKILHSIGCDLVASHVVVLGQGTLVGRPVTHLLLDHVASLSVIDNTTENPQAMLTAADVIISAIGKSGFVTGSMVKPGAVVIDAGTSEDDGAVVGDVDILSVEPVASYVSPTPGGVGPVTVAMLLCNVLSVAKKISSK